MQNLHIVSSFSLHHVFNAAAVVGIVVDVVCCNRELIVRKRSQIE